MSRRPLILLMSLVTAVVLVLTGVVSGPEALAATAPSQTGMRVTMSDGVTLAATLSGSAVDARPTVVEFTPYGESGKSYSVGPDYNYLLVHIRGTGDSDGTFDALGPRSQLDVVQSLQWACRQPFSNGSLAVAGFSASAIMIFNSLHEKLPCVKAAVLRSGTFELYRDLLVPGGIVSAAPGLGVLGLIGAGALVSGPARLQRDPLSALAVILGLGSAGLQAGLLHPTLDRFWADRGFRGDVNRLPTLLLDGAFDVEPRGDYQAFQQLRSEGADPHLLVTGAHDGAPAGTDFGQADITRWLDHYVRGVDNGIQNDPPVQMLLADGDREDLVAGKYVRYQAQNWPIPGTAWTPLYLSPQRSGAATSLNDGSLSTTEPSTTASAGYLSTPSLFTQTEPNLTALLGNFGGVVDPGGGAGGANLNTLTTVLPGLTDMNGSDLTGLTYTSAPLTRGIVAAGPADLDLRLASTLPTTDIWAVISDVSPDGTAHPMAVGRLNTGFADIVPSRSLYSGGRLVQPYGDYTHPTSTPVGTQRTYHVEFWPIANRFATGHRIQLTILGPSATVLPALPAFNTVVTGGADGSRLMFPVAPDSGLVGDSD